NGIVTLLRNPHELVRLREDPALLAPAVEELLRYESPSQHTARLAPDDTTLGGKLIRKRQAVLALMAAGNRDPDRFPDRARAYLAERDAAAPGTIAARPRGAVAPLSFAQQQVWLHAQLAPELPLYNEPLTIRRRGPLDVAALEAALTEIVRRHEAWRTTFTVERGVPVQVVQPPFPVKLPVEDLTALAPDTREAAALRLAHDDARRPFDLAAAP